jgi:hypothetical protein
MEEMKEINMDAYKWLEERAPNTWVRALQSDFLKCDILLNNNCEVLNKLKNSGCTETSSKFGGKENWRWAKEFISYCKEKKNS